MEPPPYYYNNPGYIPNQNQNDSMPSQNHAMVHGAPALTYYDYRQLQREQRGIASMHDYSWTGEQHQLPDTFSHETYPVVIESSQNQFQQNQNILPNVNVTPEENSLLDQQNLSQEERLEEEKKQKREKNCISAAKTRAKQKAKIDHLEINVLKVLPSMIETIEELQNDLAFLEIENYSCANTVHDKLMKLKDNVKSFEY